MRREGKRRPRAGGDGDGGCRGRGGSSRGRSGGRGLAPRSRSDRSAGLPTASPRAGGTATGVTGGHGSPPATRGRPRRRRARRGPRRSQPSRLRTAGTAAGVGTGTGAGRRCRGLCDRQAEAADRGLRRRGAATDAADTVAPAGGQGSPPGTRGRPRRSVRERRAGDASAGSATAAVAAATAATGSCGVHDAPTGSDAPRVAATERGDRRAAESLGRGGVLDDRGLRTPAATARRRGGEGARGAASARVEGSTSATPSAPRGRRSAAARR